MNLYDWESVHDEEYDGFLREQERMIQGQRDRRTDEADGFFAPEEVEK
jgi:hypothetical protein